MNGLFRAHDVPGFYLAMTLARGGLAAVLPALHRLPFDGLNLTHPLKDEGAAAADSLDPAAARLGAVNTLVRTEGGWHGLSTDGAGLTDWLREVAGVAVAGRKVVLLGAGGAARGAALALRDGAPTKLTVINRSAGRFGSGFFRDLAASGVELIGEAAGPAATGRLAEADVLVHATPYGLGGGGGAPPWDLAAIRPATFVVDMNYSVEVATPFLAALAGHPRRADGRGMLAGQAARGFAAWTGRDASVREALAAGGFGDRAFG